MYCVVSIPSAFRFVVTMRILILSIELGFECPYLVQMWNAAVNSIKWLWFPWLQIGILKLAWKHQYGNDAFTLDASRSIKIFMKTTYLYNFWDPYRTEYMILELYFDGSHHWIALGQILMGLGNILDHDGYRLRKKVINWLIENTNVIEYKQ